MTIDPQAFADECIDYIEAEMYLTAAQRSLIRAAIYMTLSQKGETTSRHPTGEFPPIDGNVTQGNGEVWKD